MGIFDFLKDAGDTKGVVRTDADMDDLRKGNAIIQKFQAAGLPVQGVKIDYDDGRVTLRGSVPSDDVREKMVLLAGNTPGVSRVVDEIDGEGRDLKGRLYTVEKGDTLSGIAEKRLGDAGRWKDIHEANRGVIDDPDKIYPGQVLRLPA